MLERETMSDQNRLVLAYSGGLDTSVAISYLKERIRVLEARVVPDDFHARYAAHTKTYLYRIHNSPIDSPFASRYYTKVPGRLDADRMQQAAQYFVGTHDFLALCASGSSAAAHGDTVRTITACEVERRGIRYGLAAN